MWFKLGFKGKIFIDFPTLSKIKNKTKIISFPRNVPPLLPFVDFAIDAGKTGTQTHRKIFGVDGKKSGVNGENENSCSIFHISSSREMNIKFYLWITKKSKEFSPLNKPQIQYHLNRPRIHLMGAIRKSTFPISFTRKHHTETLGSHCTTYLLHRPILLNYYLLISTETILYIRDTWDQ